LFAKLFAGADQQASAMRVARAERWREASIDKRHNCCQSGPLYRRWDSGVHFPGSCWWRCGRFRGCLPSPDAITSWRTRP
jgi:hypothetical protein